MISKKNKKTTLILLLLIVCSFSFSQNNNTKTDTKLIQPAYLKAGDTVAIVAPSGILKNREGEVQQAVNLLKSGVATI